MDSDLRTRILDAAEDEQAVQVAQARYGEALACLTALLPSELKPLLLRVDDAHGAAICAYAIAGWAAREVLP